jgi:hypothetical protein
MTPRSSKVTDLLVPSCWSPQMRVIVRKERPRPGAQLRITDANGHRLTGLDQRHHQHPTQRARPETRGMRRVSGQGATAPSRTIVFLAAAGQRRHRPQPRHHIGARRGRLGVEQPLHHHPGEEG